MKILNSFSKAFDLVLLTILASSEYNYLVNDVRPTKVNVMLCFVFAALYLIKRIVSGEDYGKGKSEPKGEE